jgi:hypothetical protein
VLRRRVGQEGERVTERRTQDGEPVAAPAGRAGEVDDERGADCAGGPAAEESVRRTGGGVGVERLGDPGLTSRGVSPVPPVVRTSRAEAASSRIAAAISARSSGTIRRSTS